MSKLYNTIESLCEAHGINVTTMCRESGAARGSLTDLKMGRTATLTAETLQKIADYFNVPIDRLLGNEKAPPGGDAELWELRQAMVDRPELKVLFDMTKGASPARVRKMLKMMELLEDEDD